MHRLTGWSLAHPAATGLAVAALCGVAALGALRLRSETGFRAALGADHPQVERLDRFIRDFGGGLPVVVAWSCAGAPCAHVLDADSLAVAHALETRLRRVEAVRRVQSPASAPLLLPNGDVRALFEGGRPAPDLADLAAQALDDPLWEGSLVAADGGAAALWVELESSNPRAHEAAVHALRAALEPFEAQGYDFALVGDPIDFVVGGGALNEEPKKLGAFTAGLVLATLWILFRSLRAAVPALVGVGVAILWTIGGMGWAGWPENEISQALVPLLLVVGVCDALHLLARFADLNEGDGTRAARQQVLRAAARDVAWPCTITSLTTAAGFVSFATSGLGSVARFGLAAGFGVAAALLLTFTLLPVLLDRLGVDLRPPRSSPTWRRALSVVSNAGERHARAILALSLAALVLAAFGLERLRVDVSKESLMGSASPIVRWQRWVTDHLRRPDTLEVRLTLPEGAEASDPLAFDRLGAAAALLAEWPELGRARSIAEPVARMNQILHDGDPAAFRPGDSAEQNAQLLFALASVDKAALDHWVTPDRRNLRLSVEADLLTMTERVAMLERVDAALAQALPEGWSHELTGPFQLFAVMVSGIHSTQTRSFFTASLLIALLVAFALRSPGAALWVMVPTLLPVLMTLGAMGLSGVALDTGTAMIAAVVLGIAVDDSVHLVTRFRRHRSRGLEAHDAMRSALQEVGRPIVASSLALAIGFLSLLMSSWESIAAFGFLSAVAILLALAADLFLLPALLFAFRPRGSRPSERTPLSRREAPGPARALLVLVLAGPVAGLLLATAVSLAGDARTGRPACAPLASGAVPLGAALDGRCPLAAPGVAHPVDGADGVYETQRAGDGARVRVPWLRESPRERLAAFAWLGTAASLSVALCALLVWHSPTLAAVPLAVAAAGVSSLTLAAVPTPSRVGPEIAAAVGLSFLPGAVAHLALTFPGQSLIVRVAPRAVAAVYLACAGLAAAATLALLRFPELFSLVVRVTLALVTAAAAALVVGCAGAMRHAAGSALERARARLLLLGVGVLAAGALALVAAEPVVLRVPGGRAGAVALTGLLGLLPIAYAVHRYQLFDLRRDVRGVVRELAHFGFFAAALVALHSMAADAAGAAQVVGLGAAAWLGSEALRRGWDAVDRRRDRRARRLGGLREEHGRRAQRAPSAQEIGRATAEAIMAGCGGRLVRVFVRGGFGWQLVDSGGERAEEGALVDLAAAVAADGAFLHLAREEETQAELHDALRARGIEVALPIETADGCLGVVFVGRGRESCATEDLRFLRAIGAQAAVALQWAAAVLEVRESERAALRGYVATSLAHDLGKPLALAWGLARDLRRRPGLDETLGRGLAQIQAQADRALEMVDQLVHSGSAGEERRPLGEVVAQAIATVQSRTGRRIGLRFRGRPVATGSFELHQVLASVLENACQATRPDGRVEVAVAAPAGGASVIEIADGGCGMDARTAQRAFEPGFSTRGARGSHGLGLALCRSILKRLGGRIEIAATGPRRGTCVRVVLPPPADGEGGGRG